MHRRMNVRGIAPRLFSDLTKMVTMQNLFHDGGFSFTGVTGAVIEQMEK
jgi:enoyl-[acyl-carrier protein] reductase I